MKVTSIRRSPVTTAIRQAQGHAGKSINTLGSRSPEVEITPDQLLTKDFLATKSTPKSTHKKHLRMLNSYIASPVILFPFYLCKDIVHEKPARCLHEKRETVCPRTRVHVKYWDVFFLSVERVEV